MVCARLLYNGQPEWGILEEKYVRLIDSAPYDAWNYLGTEVRIARAKFCPPVTGQLICVPNDGKEKFMRKNAARVGMPGPELPCPPDGLAFLCGLAALLGPNGTPYGYMLYTGGAIGPFFTDTLLADGVITVYVNGEMRMEQPVAACHAALLHALQRAGQQTTLNTGDVVASVSSAGKLYCGDKAELQLPGLDVLRLAGCAQS